MKNKFIGLRTTIYKVTDMAKAKEWYTKAFDTPPYFDEPFYIGFNIAGYELGLQPAKADISPEIPNVISYWGTDNVESSYKYLLSIGATTHEKPQNVGGQIVVASVKDPWNNAIGIIYNPDFKVQD